MYFGRNTKYISDTPVLFGYVLENVIRIKHCVIKYCDQTHCDQTAIQQQYNSNTDLDYYGNYEQIKSYK